MGIKHLLYTTFIIVWSHSLLAQQSNRPTAILRPADYEYLSAPDSLGNRFPLKSPSLERTPELKLPYPIIFIHGLNSSSATWDSTTNWMELHYGFSFGGRFDFCLNYDADYYFANKYFDSVNADMALFTSAVSAGDYYYVNFDVSTEGLVSPGYWDNGFVRSNQSAIAKQGFALKWVIEKVLQETGRDKVILMGHSMGGLASREYLQNSDNWQSDGYCHVAKLVTTGTPHGGSNSTAYGLGLFVGLDEETEAVRDLRRSYYYSQDSGVFLYGGREEMTDSTMDDNLGVDFYNVDINCDGQTGQAIVGLNQKTLYRDLDYSCIVGNCDGCWAGDGGIGDGVVNNFCANLNNFYPDLDAEVFNYHAPAYAEIHTVLPGLNYENMLGLDEPDRFQLAYNIDLNTDYTGFITMQAKEPYAYDYDYFKFVMPYNGLVSITVNNSILPDLTVVLFDSVFNSPGFVVQDFSTTDVTLTRMLSRGDYYLRISAIADSISYLHPYHFTMEASPATSVVDVSVNSPVVLLYPNPVKAQLTIDTKDIADAAEVEIFNLLGESIYSAPLTGNAYRINTETFQGGVYIMKITTGNRTLVRKFIKE